MSDPRPLVLLHGSDGRETDLLPLAERLAPAAAKVSIRGAVRTPGGEPDSSQTASSRCARGDSRKRQLWIHNRVSPS